MISKQMLLCNFNKFSAEIVISIYNFHGRIIKKNGKTITEVN